MGDTLDLFFDTTTEMESPVFVLTNSTERITIGHIKENFERKVVADILNSWGRFLAMAGSRSYVGSSNHSHILQWKTL
jgi:hypothetical protein